MPKGLQKGNSNSPALFPLAAVSKGSAQCLAFIRDLKDLTSLLEEFIAEIPDAFSHVREELQRAMGQFDEAKNYIENAGMSAFCDGMPAVSRGGVK